MKKLILFILALFFSLSLVHAADFYQVYEMNFSDEIPEEVFVAGGECLDATCTTFANTNIQVFEAEAVTCLNEVLNGTIGVNTFQSCVNAQVQNDQIIAVNESAEQQLFVTKVTVPAQFGHLVYFSTEGDSYIPKTDRITNYQCDFDICIDTDLPQLDFIKKDGGIAEIQQVNIINTEDPNRPIQIEIPVEIEETVCSAYELVNSDFARVEFPQGFSDIDANTIVSLEISRTGTQEFLFEEFITLPIEADICADLAAFEFTPEGSLENEELTFRVETTISDRQVINARQDFFETTETVFSNNLEGACFVRAFDFTLSNEPDFELTSTTAQITQGETLFAGFTAIGLRDNELNSIPFSAEIFIDNQRVFTQNFAASNELQEHFVDISSIGSQLDLGAHEVRLVVSPQDTQVCEQEEQVVQIQNLEVQEVETFTVNFFLRDLNASPIENANVSLSLLEARDFFVNDIEFDENKTSNAQGQASFDNVPAGDFFFLVDAINFTLSSGNLVVGSDTDVFLTLDQNNLAPIIDLPNEIQVVDIDDELSIDLRDFVFDPNDAFEFLDFDIELLEGDLDIDETLGFLTLSSDVLGSSTIRVTVEDSEGAIASDTLQVEVVDNLLPLVEIFEANPSSGTAPFETEFSIQIDDENEAALICTLNFGDGTSIRDNCIDLNGITHIFNEVGTFTATLSVEDGVNNPVIAEENIFVFNEINDFPLIEEFIVDSSNGIFVPTNLSIDWQIIHTANLDMVCELIINSEVQIVDCIDSLDLLNFERLGVSTFTIRATDTQFFQVEETIQINFRPLPQELAEIDAQLIIDEEIFGNKINFAIDVDNELERKRQIEVQPRIVCDGARAKVSNTQDGFLSTSLRSRVESPANGLFEFSLEKRDFNLLIPEDENCRFEVLLRDEFGEEFLLSQNTIFRDSDDLDNGKVPSIRGHGSDILSYMLSALQDMRSGFNIISFRIENHHEEGKEFTMTVISRELGIETTVVEKIGADNDQEIQVPVFISDRYEAGMYPARISVFDEEQRQTRYTYIKVVE
jgi:PKD repeat protein